MQLVPAAEAAQRGKNEVSSSLLAREGGRHCRKYLSLLWRRWAFMRLARGHISSLSRTHKDEEWRG